MDNFYPIKLLATGGMIGNSIFFMLSSLCLYLNWGEKGKTILRNWYGQRIMRIYPPVWVTVIFIIIPISIYFGLLRPDNFLEKMGMFFFPPFWFLQALLIYYLIMFFILKQYSQRLLVVIATPVLLLYGIYYGFILDTSIWSIEELPFKLIFYFLIILWGFYLGSMKERINFSGIADIFLLFLCLGIIYIHKYLMYRELLASLQFVQHLAVFPLLYYLLKVARSHFILSTIMKNTVLARITNFLSKNTLEIFIVSNSILVVFNQLELIFPLTAIAFVVTSLITASFVCFCTTYIRRIIDR
jgi:peptidoglycan/LPS O-acetylase OafA/YrhL